MKTQEILLNALTENGKGMNGHSHEETGDNHLSANLDTPMISGAFEMPDHEKKYRIAEHFTEIMKILGLDMDDDSLKGTPDRVAKMYVEEIFSGLDPENKPEPTLFNNTYQYKQMLVEKNITLFSTCEHHFVPIVGVAHVAYISSGKVIGLSKLNRIVQYYAKQLYLLQACRLSHWAQQAHMQLAHWLALTSSTLRKQLTMARMVLWLSIPI